jgi:hypothetical protein
MDGFIFDGFIFHLEIFGLFSNPDRKSAIPPTTKP